MAGPQNPVDGEAITVVESGSSTEAARRFRSAGRLELAELHQLAALVRDVHHTE